jgi:hypothetical protein
MRKALILVETHSSKKMTSIELSWASTSLSANRATLFLNLNYSLGNISYGDECDFQSVKKFDKHLRLFTRLPMMRRPLIKTVAQKI